MSFLRAHRDAATVHAVASGPVAPPQPLPLPMLSALIGEWPEPMLLLDDGGRVVGANGAAESLTGRAADALCGTHLLELIDVDDRSTIRDLLARLDAGDAGERVEVRFVGRDRGGWVDLIATRLTHDRAVGMVVVHAFDCTKRKQAEFQAQRDMVSAREADRRYRVAFQTTVVGMATADIDGRLTNVNAALGTLLGEDPEALVGRHVAELVVPEEQLELRRTVAHLLAGDLPGPHQQQSSYMSTAGERVVTETALVPIGDDQDIPLSLMIFVLDVTARVAAVAALESALSREQQAFEALQGLEETKSQLLAAVSHDFRSPLAAIGGFAFLLVDQWDGFEPAELRDMADRIRRNAVELDSRVTEFVDVARSGHAIDGPTMEPFDLATVVEEAVQRCRFVLDRHKVEVDAPSLPVVSYNRAVARIVENLLTNAAKYSPAGTTVRVRVASTANGAEVTVADEGPGITASERELIFKPFVRLQDRAGNAWGAGVGLPGARSLAEALGGTLTVSDGPHGSGTTFTLTLPG